jgi:starch synthase
MPSPTLDAALAQTYDAKTLAEKVQNKVALQEELGWPAEPKRAMICLPAGMSDVLGGTLLKEVLPGLLTLPVELVILGKGGAAYGSYFTELAKEHPHRIAIIPNKPEWIAKMLAASDMALFLADPDAQSEVETCLSYGTLPVSLPGKSVKDYNPNQETGNAFVFEKATQWHCFGALVRALETHRFPFDWRTIQRHAMEESQ